VAFRAAEERIRLAREHRSTVHARLQGHVHQNRHGDGFAGELLPRHWKMQIITAVAA
jgi:hypothetical protein